MYWNSHERNANLIHIRNYSPTHFFVGPLTYPSWHSQTKSPLTFLHSPVPQISGLKKRTVFDKFMKQIIMTHNPAVYFYSLPHIKLYPWLEKYCTNHETPFTLWWAAFTNIISLLSIIFAFVKKFSVNLTLNSNPVK